MMDVLRFLFDGDSFMIRNHCGDWPPGWPWFYAMANAITSVSYFGISLCLLYLIRRGVSYKLSDVHAELALFMAFIFFCGVGHLEGVLSFWWPAYKLFTVWHVLTAVVSLTTFLVLAFKSVQVYIYYHQKQ